MAFEGPCPGDTQILRYLDGTLEAGAAASIDAHADRCPSCRDLVAGLLVARSSSGSSVSFSFDAGVDPDEPDPEEVGRRYLVLGLIGQGGMGRVFHAVDRLTGAAVALKRVALRPGARVEALAHEFSTLATLSHPNVIRVLDYGFDLRRRPYFTMELLTGARQALRAAEALEPAGRIDLLIQVLRALAYLHRRGVLHLDVKPSNILVVPGEGGLPQVKLLDFGLASSGGGDPHEQAPAGTLPYVAPELFEGLAASEASDLYAVGVVAYQVLAGRHPFQAAGGPRELIAKVLAGAPDLSPLPAALRGIVGRALSRSPRDRPADAGALLRELSAAAGLAPRGEPAASKESYLVSARFTGREEELGLLCGALEETRRGRGSAWLLGGESGAGKSRLVEELRGRAMVRGVLTVRGQAGAGDGTAYHLWRRVLEVLALHVELDDLEARVLSLVVPRLGALLERPVGPPPALDSQAARFRLLSVLRDVVERSREPLLVILEDLHASDAESLALLAQVARDAGTLPLLVAATFRDDEAPGLPGRLGSMRRLAVRRFDRAGVQRLCESMLGSAGRDQELVDLVARETEGNAFFVVEVARALAEESGGRGRDGGRGLPERVLAGGVEQVLARRLGRVPEEARPLLRLAALAGRELDLEALARSVGEAGALAQKCAEAGVLEVHEQRWRFSHDRLREHVLEALDDGERRALHAEIARGLEEAYPDSPAHASRKAHHHREAGALAQAARCYAAGGEAALARGAPGEAEAMLEQALALQGRVAATRLEQARAWRLMAHARLGQGRSPEADVALQRLCELAGAALPASAGRWWRMVLRHLAEHLARRAGLYRMLAPRPGPEAKALRGELLLGLSIVEIYVWLDRPERVLLCALWGMNLEAALAPSPRRTDFRLALALVLAYTPLRRRCGRFLARAVSEVERGTLAEMGYLRVQAVHLANEGRWGEALEIAGQAVAIARAQKDVVSLVHCLLPLQIALGGRGDYPRLLEASRELEQLANRLGNPRYLVFAHLWQGLVWLRQGDFARLQEAVERARRAMPDGLGALSESIAAGMEATCALHQGQAERAQALADAAMEAIQRVRWTLVELRHSLVCVLEVWLVTGAGGRHDRKIQMALSRLRRIARRFPCAEPNYHFYQGRWLALRGLRERAAVQLRRSLASAERLSSWFNVGQARYWLGCLQEPPDRDHLAAALELFERLGCPFEAGLARAVLDRASSRAVKI